MPPGAQLGPCKLPGRPQHHVRGVCGGCSTELQRAALMPPFSPNLPAAHRAWRVATGRAAPTRVKEVHATVCILLAGLRLLRADELKEKARDAAAERAGAGQKRLGWVRP